MTNREKLLNENPILSDSTKNNLGNAIALKNGEPTLCDYIACVECDFSKYQDCRSQAEYWLNEDSN